MDDVPGRVAQYLYLDVTGPVHRLLKENCPIAEGRRSLPDRACRRLGEILGSVHPAQPPAATPGRGLHEQGEAHRLGGFGGGRRVRQRS